MKSCRKRSGIAPLVLNLSTRLRWVFNFTPRPSYLRERTPVPRAGLGVFGEESLGATDIRTPDCPAHSIPATLTRLTIVKLVVLLMKCKYNGKMNVICHLRSTNSVHSQLTIFGLFNPILCEHFVTRLIKIRLNETYNRVRVGTHLPTCFLLGMFWNKEMLYRHCFSTLF